MAFSIWGILAVLLEAVRPYFPALLVVLLIEVALLGWLLTKRELWRRQAARKVTVACGVLLFFLALAFIPAFTKAGFDDLRGLLDYGVLLLATLGCGVAAGILLYLPIQAMLVLRQA